MPSSAKLSRRSIVTGAASAAASIAVTMPVAAASGHDPDRALFDLVERFWATHARYEEAEQLAGRLEDEYCARLPEPPKELRWRDGDKWRSSTSIVCRRGRAVVEGQQQVELCDPDDIEWLRDKPIMIFGNARPDEAAQARLDQVLAAYDRYSATCVALNAELGLDRADAEFSTIEAHLQQLERELAATGATTDAGVKAKAEIVVKHLCNGDLENLCGQDELLRSLIRDLVPAAAKASAL
jgi:hypothetical protein